MKNSTKLIVGGLFLVLSGPLPIWVSVVPNLIGGFLLGNVLHYLIEKEREERSRS